MAISRKEFDFLKKTNNPEWKRWRVEPSRKVDVLTSETAGALYKSGYKRYMDTPYRQSILYSAKTALQKWNYCRENYCTVTKQQALHVIASQPFTSLNSDWIDMYLPWN